MSDDGTVQDTQALTQTHTEVAPFNAAAEIAAIGERIAALDRVVDFALARTTERDWEDMGG